MAGFAWNKFHVTGAGNLNLGIEADDGAGDATHTWAKGDCWVNVPLPSVPAMCLTQAGTFARTSAGLYTVALAAAASTGIVVVPITGILRKFSGTPAIAAPHGFKLTDFVLNYTVATAGETSVNVTFNSNLDVNATARAAIVNAGMGAVTYENPIGTAVANLPVATQATPYVCRAIPATPIFINIDRTDLYAEIAVVNPGTSVLTFTYIGFHVSVALY